MSDVLCDQNVWLALVLRAHRHHSVAKDWWDGLESSRPALFCRSTQQGFLRLLTTEAVFKPYGLPPRSQREAWTIVHGLMSDPCCSLLTEPFGIDPIWERLSTGDRASPKLWMDAYLAAVAIVADCQLVTFDQGFQKFEGEGLRLRLLG